METVFTKKDQANKAQGLKATTMLENFSCLVYPDWGYTPPSIGSRPGLRSGCHWVKRE
jgi:hypothetical protein